MSANKYIAEVSDRVTEVRAADTSTGVADAGRIIALNSVGLLDITLFPPGSGITISNLTGTAGAEGIYSTLVGSNFQLKKVQIGSNKLSLTGLTEEVVFDVIPGNIDHDDLLNHGIRTHSDIDIILDDLSPLDAVSLDTRALTVGSTSFSTAYLSAGNINYDSGAGAGTSQSYVTTDGTFILTLPLVSNTGVNKGDKGTLDLYINGALKSSYDLFTNFNEANRTTQQTYTPATGSGVGGAISRIKITLVVKYNNWRAYQRLEGYGDIAAADLRQGYNYFTIVHNISGDIQTSATYKIFYDTDSSSISVTTPTIADNTVVTKYMSGVKYYYRGSDWNVTVPSPYITNLFANVYIQNPVSVSSTSNTMGSATVGLLDGSVSGISNPPSVAEVMHITNKLIAAPASDVRSLNARVTVIATDPYGASGTGTSASANRLVDLYLTGSSGNSSDLSEPFDDEFYRIPSNATHTTATYGSGAGGGWDSSQSIHQSATAGYSSGLMIQNGSLKYPTAINYNSGYLPTSQVDYGTTAINGTRYYYRYFYVGAGKQTLTITMTGSSTTFVSVGTGLTGNNVTLEMLIPNTTQNGSAVLEFKDCVTTFNNNDTIGCLNSSVGTVSVNTSTWVVNFGTRSTTTGGNIVTVRITAGVNWSGTIDSFAVA